LLTVDNAIAFLLNQRLVDAKDVVEGDLKIVDAARRNRNLRVTRRSGLSYLIKQPDPREAGARHTLSTEARFYTFCEREPRAAPMLGLMPRLFQFDPDPAILVLELLQPSVTLRDYYMALGSGRFPSDACEGIGRALGTFHRTCRLTTLADVAALQGLPSAVPWILAVHKPGPEMLAKLSPANTVVLKILQQDIRVTRALDGLRQEWRTETLIHNDIKADNVLLIEDNGQADVRLVDWELIQMGDPAWDLGGLFHDALLHSMPASSSRTPSEQLEEAGIPLALVREVIRGMWLGYQKVADLTIDSAAGLLERSIGYAAARIIQSAYEHSSSAPSVSNHAVVMLQLAANVLADPAAAALSLFGLPAVWILGPS
jgi:5-methylthioribose kinase